MKREKNGRFKKNPKLEIEFPTVKSIIKYLFIFIVLLLCVYLMIFKYDIMQLKKISHLFSGPKSANAQSQKLLIKELNNLKII